MKRLLLFFAIAFCTIYSNAQTGELTWHSLIQKNGIEVFYAIGNCSNSQKLFVKVKNTNSIKADTNFTLVTSENISEIIEHNLIITLNGNEEFIVDCENSSFTETFIIGEITNSQIFSCEIKNLNINLQ